VVRSIPGNMREFEVCARSVKALRHERVVEHVCTAALASRLCTGLFAEVTKKKKKWTGEVNGGQNLKTSSI
jgi:hypothetical protein